MGPGRGEHGSCFASGNLEDTERSMSEQQRPSNPSTAGTSEQRKSGAPSSRFSRKIDCGGGTRENESVTNPPIKVTGRGARGGARGGPVSPA